MTSFDIGANIGKWALANVNRYDKIIAVEASPRTFVELQKNCINDKIIPLNYAVCKNDNEDIIFYDSRTDTLSTLNKEWLTNPISRFYNHDSYIEIMCKTISLDTLIEQYGKPCLIKIDVEGGEFSCISSLTQKVDLLCFEWASELKDVSINCVDYLYTLGFSQFYIQNDDNYTFIPENNMFYDIETLKYYLSKTIPKIDWGMIWCK